MSNNPYVIDGGYKPFSMQEMLTPFLLYKDAWDKSQEQMDKYNQGADAFKYLDETLPEGSQARGIYDNYAKDLRAAEESYNQNGLTMDNTRALLGLRRRYTGEIGRLEKASTKLDEIRKLRMAQDMQDPTMIYSKDNPTIDDVLDGKNFNQYGISGDSLYKRGMQAGAAISQRHFSNLELQKITDNPAFLDAVQKVGFTPEVLHAFNVNPDAIPEFKEAITSIMKSTGAEANLKGAKNEQAVQNVIRGLIDGAVYKRSDSLQQNPDYIDAKSREALTLQKKQLDLQAKENGMIENKDGSYTYVPTEDPALQKAIAIQQVKNAGKTGKGKSGNGGDDIHPTQLKGTVEITWNHNNPAYAGKGQKNYSQYHNADGTIRDGSVTQKTLENDEKPEGVPMSYDELPSYAKYWVDKNIKDGDPNYYNYYYVGYKPGALGFMDDREAKLYIEPRDLTTDKASSSNVDDLLNMVGK